MVQYTIFTNAPITEALLDIRVRLSEHINLEIIESFHEYVKENFPEKKQRIAIQAGFKITPKVPLADISSSSKQDGYFFRSPMENKVVQARTDGFTFNKLKPYENWGRFSDEARSLWNLYFQLVNPVKITRIALRYINRIEIPLPIKDFKDYILTTPEIAPKLPQGLSHFFMQLVIPNHDIQAIATINQTMEQPTLDGKLPYIFDIDVWQETNYTNNENEMWDKFNKLREFKNEIFFNSITEKTEELFK